MIWGIAGPWYGEYGCSDGDVLMKQLNFLVKNGFKSMTIGLEEMNDPARCDQIANFVAKHDMQLATHLYCNWIKGYQDDLKQRLDIFAEGMRKYADLLRVPIVTTGPGPTHRFMRQPPLKEQIELMSESLTPAAKLCHELGRPLGIENHGNYYCSDLVELCKMTPHLMIYLDTGNTYLIGEKSIPGCRDAAPYTIGTHFKDHYVEPNLPRLSFDLDGAPLGHGDVGLLEVYKILLENAPNPDKLIMHWEMVTPKGMNPLECMEISWKFIHSLEEIA